MVEERTGPEAEPRPGTGVHFGRTGGQKERKSALAAGLLAGDRPVPLDDDLRHRVDHAVPLLRLDVVEAAAEPVAGEPAVGHADQAEGEGEDVGPLADAGGGG